MILDFETSLDRSLSAKAMPLSSEGWALSTRVTGTEALRAATRAIPRPIWPAPMTPSFLISRAMLGEEENWRFRAERRAVGLVGLGWDMRRVVRRVRVDMLRSEHGGTGSGV